MLTPHSGLCMENNTKQSNFWYKKEGMLIIGMLSL